MHRLVPVLQRELTYCARECFKCILIAAVYVFSLWFFIDGLPRLVAIINGRTP